MKRTLRTVVANGNPSRQQASVEFYSTLLEPSYTRAHHRCDLMAAENRNISDDSHLLGTIQPNFSLLSGHYY